MQKFPQILQKVADIIDQLDPNLMEILFTRLGNQAILVLFKYLIVGLEKFFGSFAIS